MTQALADDLPEGVRPYHVSWLVDDNGELYHMAVDYHFSNPPFTDKDVRVLRLPGWGVRGSADAGPNEVPERAASAEKWRAERQARDSAFREVTQDTQAVGE